MIQAIEDKDFQLTLDKHVFAIVYFHADWCGICKEFYKKFNGFVEEGNNSDVLFLSVNAEENILASQIAHVENLPFFASFKEGKFLEGVATNKIENLHKLASNLKK